tara:strand:+ start:1881 stop:3539 length:1659 start_codon:yes stop_codon:yes gene_type:complete
MRVPTYKQQTSFTTKGGGGRFLTAQINPSVMAKQGQVISEIGDDITRIGLRKLEVETETDVNVAKRAMNTELYSIREKYLKSENPVKAELKAKAEMQTLLKQYVNGTKINPVTNEPYISTNKSKARFLSVGQDLLSSNILEYVKENNKLISEVNKANISDTTNELVKSAIDSDNFGEFNERYQQIFSVNDKNPGVLRLALTNGDYDQNEYAAAFDKTAEILVDGLILKKLKSSPSALAAAIEIFDDPSANVAITNALGLLDNKADKRAKVIKLAKQIDDEKVQEIEREEKAQIEKNDKLYAEIINADLDNEDKRNAAIGKHRILKSQNYYESTSKLNETEKLLGIQENKTNSDTKKSDRATIALLDKLDRNNLLTVQALEKVAEKLSDPDYKIYLKRIQTEINDGFKEAHNMFRNELNYSENLDTTSGAGKSIQLLYNQALQKLQAWKRSENKAKREITFVGTLDKADDIIDENKLAYRKIMKESLISYLGNIKSQLERKIPGFTFDLNKPYQSTIDAISTLGNPALSNDLIIKGVYQNLLGYKKFNVDAVQ